VTEGSVRADPFSLSATFRFPTDLSGMSRASRAPQLNLAPGSCLVWRRRWVL